MTGPELDLLEGGGGNADVQAGPLGPGGRVALATTCENGGKWGQHPTGAADYVSRLAVRARLRANGHPLTGGADYQRRYELAGIRFRR
jgi:hypothetical protein